VGIDGDSLRRPLTGIGTYVYSLCSELGKLLPDAEFIAYSRMTVDALSVPSGRWHVRSEPNTFLRRMPSNVWVKSRCGRLCAVDGLDVFWAGRTLLPHLPSSVSTVATVHDLNVLVVPETMPLVNRWSHRLWLRGDLRRADRVVANSCGTAYRVKEMLGVDVVDVVRPGVAEAFCTVRDVANEALAEELARLRVYRPYVLSVATLEPRKNVGALLDAFLEMRAEGDLPGVSLVLAGAGGWGTGSLRERLRSATGDGVVLLGYVPDALMPFLYRGAEALIVPSVYEGFGMPALEGRVCGTRVVVSDVPELREAGGEGAIVIEPSVAGIKEGLRRALAQGTEPGGSLVEGDYSWAASARRFAKVILEVVARRRESDGSHGHAVRGELGV